MYIYLLICIIFSISHCNACQEHVITLEDAIYYSLSSNPSLNELESRLDETLANIQMAKSSYYPQIELDAILEGGDSSSLYLFKTIDAGTLDSQTNFNKPGRITNIEYGVSFEQEIYSWGERSDTVKASELSSSSISYQLSDYKNRLIAMVISTYVDILSFQSVLETTIRSMDLISKQLAILKEKRQEKVVLESDVLKLEVRLAEMQAYKHHAITAIDTYLINLKTLMGREDHESEISISTETPSLAVNPDTDAWDFVLNTPKNYLVSAAEKNAQSAYYQQKAATKKKLPRIHCFGRAYIDTPDSLNKNKRSNWVLGCGLSWKIFSGGQLRGSEKVAKAKYIQAHQRLKEEKLHTKQRLSHALLKKRELEKILEVALLGQKSAESSYSLLEKQFTAGRASVTNYLEAEKMLLDASLRKTSIFYELFKANIYILQETGYLSRYSICQN